VKRPASLGTVLAACLGALVVGLVPCASAAAQGPPGRFDVDPRGAVHTFPTDFGGVSNDVPRSRQSLAEETLSKETAQRLQETAWEATHLVEERSSSH